MINTLRYSSLNNPKLFWNILNDNVGKTLNFSNDISVDNVFQFLKNMNYSKVDDGSDFSQYFDTDFEMYGLNYPITPEEILQCINNLKSNKAAGSDGIVNEYIYTTFVIFLPIYVPLFNLVFDNCVMPDVWIAGIIKPIYKNKGDKNNPDNYRGIIY